MKKLILSLSAIIGTAGTAFAADLPVKAPRIVAPIAYNWTGCYIGVAGGGIGSRVVHDRAPTDGLATFLGPAETAGASRSTDTRNSAGIIGGTLGCNWQAGVAVFGVEGDMSWTGSRNSFVETFPATPAIGARTETGSVNMDWLSTVRGRAGMLVSPNLLLYVTGGVAFGSFDSSLSVVTAGGSRWAGSASTVRAGGVVGAGGEWAFSGGWSVKAEYLYVDFGKHDFGAPNLSIGGGAANPAFSGFSSSVRATDHIARIGLNYKFGGGPVVARY